METSIYIEIDNIGHGTTWCRLQWMEIPSCISENVKQLENIFTQMRINAKIPCFSTICRRKILSIFQARRKVSFLRSPDIYVCKLEGSVPSYNRLINRLKITENIEEQIAYKKGKLATHVHKWFHLINYVCKWIVCIPL